MTNEDRDRDHQFGAGESSAVKESTAAAQQQIAATRERMSGTIAEIEAKVSGTMSEVKEKVDVVRLVQRHPWPALAAAVLAGVALGKSGADRKAAKATVRAAKRAPDGAKQGLRAAAAGASHLAEAAASRLKGAPDDGTSRSASSDESVGLVSKLTSPIVDRARELGAELQRGVDELPSAPPPETSRRATS